MKLHFQAQSARKRTNLVQTARLIVIAPVRQTIYEEEIFDSVPSNDHVDTVVNEPARQTLAARRHHTDARRWIWWPSWWRWVKISFWAPSKNDETVIDINLWQFQFITPSTQRPKSTTLEGKFLWICVRLVDLLLNWANSSFPTTAFLSASRSSGKAEPCATGRRPWWVTLYFHLFWTSEREVPHCSAHITPDRKKASCPVYFSWATSHATHPYSDSFFCSIRSASSNLIHNTPTI